MYDIYPGSCCLGILLEEIYNRLPDIRVSEMVVEVSQLSQSYMEAIQFFHVEKN